MQHSLTCDMEYGSSKSVCLFVCLKKPKYCEELKLDRIILISALYVKQIFTSQANGLW